MQTLDDFFGAKSHLLPTEMSAMFSKSGCKIYCRIYLAKEMIRGGLLNLKRVWKERLLLI